MLTFTTLFIQQTTKWWHFFRFSRKQDLTFHASCLYSRQFAWNVQNSQLMTFWNIFLMLSWKQVSAFHTYYLHRTSLPLQIVFSGDLRDCQTCFTGENKKRGHEFAICWVSPESDKGSTGQWIVDIIHSVGDMCRPRSDCAEMPVHLGLSCSQIP